MRLKRLIFLFILIFSLLKIILPIVHNKQLFTEKFDPKIYEKKYNNSQYVIPQSKNPISDEDIYAYAGYKYITGLNPILINSDHPPLGKYLIGIFILLTGNHRVISIFFAFIIILIFSLIVYQATLSFKMIIFGIFLISLDSMFIDQIIHSPILDIIQLFFLLLYFFCFFLWLKNDGIWYLVVCGVVLGMFSSVKMYFPTLILIGTVFVFLIFKKTHSLNEIINFIFLNLLISLLIYSLIYTQYFLEGNNFKSFLGVQKWIFLYWYDNSVRGDIFLGSVFPFILFNKWKIWWGDRNFINYENWTILWPFFFIKGCLLTVYLVYRNIKNFLIQRLNKKQINFEFFLSLWIFFYIFYLSIIPISPRYLLIIFFPIYLLLIIVADKFNKKIKNEAI